MAKTTVAAAQPHDANERCGNCGACKACGAGGRPQYVPVPYPVYPQPRPYWGQTYPYWSVITPQTSPNTVWGTGPQFTSGGNYTVTSSTNGTLQ